MLLSLFLAIFANLQRKNGVLLLLCLKNWALFWVKNANFLPIYFQKKIKKSLHRSQEMSTYS
jgi:hypothetical protein